MSKEPTSDPEVLDLTDQFEAEEAPAIDLPDGGSFTVAALGYERPAGEDGGVIQVHSGYYVVTHEDGTVSAMPPPLFFEAYPDFAPVEDEA